jgi:murein DD-endopeptidase MepM/ murein hydrolase activator NlpD
MKRWTVMLVPQGQGSTRSLHLSSVQVVAAVMLVAGLAFASTFLFQRYRLTKQDIARLEWDRMQALSTPGEGRPIVPLNPDLREEIAEEARDDYESRIALITAELSALYDLEERVNELLGWEPREGSAAGYIGGPSATGGSGESEDGRGGPPVGLGGEAVSAATHAMRPPHVIYGLSRPPADLILQEIELRRGRLKHLVTALQEHFERIARRPAGRPARGRFSSDFGYRHDPFTRKIRHHDGVDIAAPQGTPIVATGKGVVISSGREDFLGYAVRIDHGEGVRTLYGHLSKCLAKKGDTVVRGQQIGKMGSTGRSTGSHVHYEIQVNGKPIDPEPSFGN